MWLFCRIVLFWVFGKGGGVRRKVNMFLVFGKYVVGVVDFVGLGFGLCVCG